MTQKVMASYRGRIIKRVLKVLPLQGDDGVLLPTQGVLSPLCYALALGFAAFVEKELVRFRNSVEKESAPTGRAES